MNCKTTRGFLLCRRYISSISRCVLKCPPAVVTSYELSPVMLSHTAGSNPVMGQEEPNTAISASTAPSMTSFMISMLGKLAPFIQMESSRSLATYTGTSTRQKARRVCRNRLIASELKIDEWIGP